MKNKKPWTTLSSEIVHQNNWYHISHEKFVTPKNNIGDYFVINGKGGTNKSVLIIPIDKGSILFTKQFRYTVKKKCLEIPGGGCEKGSNFMQSAKKELAEELGYKASKIKCIGEFWPYVGLIPEVCKVFVAEDLDFVGQSLEETELGLKIERIKVKDAYKMLDDGKIKGGMTAVALVLARNKLLKINK